MATTAQQATKPKPAAPAGKKPGGSVSNIDKSEKQTGPRYTRKAYTCREGMTLYEARGGAGFINVRAFPNVMLFAADISDPNGKHEGAKNPDWIKGLISRFFPNKEKAEKYKADKEEEGYTVKIVPVTPYEGEFTVVK